MEDIKTEEIKNTLRHWKENKEIFDSKLVDREETGCCHSKPIGTGTTSDDMPCNE